MTRFAHDQFAKDILDETLSYIGGVTLNKRVSAEVREIDVYFMPDPDKPGYLEYKERLGLLGKMAETPALLEVFRNPVTTKQVIRCLNKLFDVDAGLYRETKRENPIYNEEPLLWVLTPTASDTLLNGLNATTDSENWGEGIYFLGECFRTGIVVIHRLPKTPETLWLRILGRGKVQEEALVSLAALPVDNPWRQNALELVYELQLNLSVNLEEKSELDTEEDLKLMRVITPLFQEHLAVAEQRGIQQGIERGIQQGIELGVQQGIERGKIEGKFEGIQQGIERGRQEENRAILENFLRVKFGALSPKSAVFITPVSTLPAVDFTILLVQLSMLSVDESGVKRGTELLAESV
ncbi:MAG TPA: flagellar assembly protein H, partial [Cyanobacteria bacterium UBA11159]|nr:flagellar assembly protein H [Cyanobacteria bacterium UBA11367]HBR77167.1 flagellar assembly protein H [Cyanobacteria bacterium UBA11159]HBS69043.1 flagellar assembly protein H [Cyanobacteria bacterium UBA11153]HCA97139.1 flagellar assembly protein H [Cyanobacteria bacterium UBA9226]